VGAGFNLGAGLGQRGAAFLAAGDFLGNGQAVLQRSGVGLLGLGQELLHFQFELLDLLPGARVAHGAVFAGAGQDLGAVGGDGELAQLQEFELLGQLQDLDKARGEQGFILAAKSAERVVVGMSVGGEQTHGHAVMGALLDAAAAESAGGVAVEEQRQEQGGRILFAARAASVDADLAQVE